MNKVMQASPRKIQEIVVDFNRDNPDDYLGLIQKLKTATCTYPVALSLDPARNKR